MMADQLQLNSLVLDARRLAVNLVQVNQQVSQVVAQTPKVEGLSDALEKSKLGELDIGALLKGEGLAAPFVSGIKAALAFEQHMHDLQLGPVKDDPLENTGLQRDALAQMLPEAGMRQGQESLEQLQGAIKGVTLAFGLALLPAFTAVAQALKPLIQGVASLIVAHPQLVEGVAAAAAAFTGLRVAATLALLAFNATPIGLVVSAVALAVGLIVAYWEPISGFFAAVGERVGAVFQAMGAAFEALLQWDPMATLQSGWSALSGFFSELWASTLTGLQSAWGMLKAVLAWSPVALLYNNWGSVAGWFADLAGRVQWAFALAWQGLQAVLAWNPLVLLYDNWGAIVGWLGDLAGQALGVLAQGWSTIAGLFEWSPLAVLSTAWGTVSGFFGELWGQLLEGMAPIQDALANLFTGSPLEWLQQWTPVAAWLGDWWAKLAPIVEPIRAFFSGAFSAVFDTFGKPGGDQQPVAAPVGATPLSSPLAGEGGSGLVQQTAEARRTYLDGSLLLRFENPPPGLALVTSQSNQPGLNIRSNVGVRSLSQGGTYES